MQIFLQRRRWVTFRSNTIFTTFLQAFYPGLTHDFFQWVILGLQVKNDQSYLHVKDEQKTNTLLKGESHDTQVNPNNNSCRNFYSFHFYGHPDFRRLPGRNNPGPCYLPGGGRQISTAG
jgi:hypothetical protein